MRLAVGLIVVACCAAGTARHLPTFQSDRALWHAAVVASPRLARPALNYADALLKAGETRDALLWLVRAAELSPEGSDVRLRIRHHLWWLEAFGEPVCGRPLVSAYC